jgi:hypothetical protein
MNDRHLGARIILAVAILNLLFHLTLLSFNIIGIPMGLIH